MISSLTPIAIPPSCSFSHSLSNCATVGYVHPLAHLSDAHNKTQIPVLRLQRECRVITQAVPALATVESRFWRDPLHFLRSCLRIQPVPVVHTIIPPSARIRLMISSPSSGSQ